MKKNNALKMMIMESSMADKKRDKGKKEMNKESAEYKKPVKSAKKKTMTKAMKSKKC